jgi:anthranilate synthase/aminodeoxychorismate synthase-like glutamine amidotransferase
MILLIDNYDSFTYNLFQYICELGAQCRVIRNDQISLEGIRKLKPRSVVISPGPGTPDESGVSLDVIRELGKKIPVFGVCLGHQAIGQVFGGKIVRLRTPVHGKVSEIRHRGKGVFTGLPKALQATRYHSLIVERKSLPKCLEITAETDEGVIMGLRHRHLPIEGVQFHPESVMTDHGKQMLANAIERGR